MLTFDARVKNSDDAHVKNSDAAQPRVTNVKTPIGLSGNRRVIRDSPSRDEPRATEAVEVVRFQNLSSVKSLANLRQKYPCHGDCSSSSGWDELRCFLTPALTRTKQIDLLETFWSFHRQTSSQLGQLPLSKRVCLISPQPNPWISPWIIPVFPCFCVRGINTRAAPHLFEVSSCSRKRCIPGKRERSVPSLCIRRIAS